MKKAYHSLALALLSAFIYLLARLVPEILEPIHIFVLEVWIFSSIIGFIVGIQNLKEEPQFFNWIGLVLNFGMMVQVAFGFFVVYQMRQN